MRRFLLALPLFLVIGLAFVELPVNASNNGNQPTVSVSAAPTTPDVTESIAPIEPLPQSNIEGKKRGPRHGGFEKHEDDEFEDDDFKEDDDFEEDDD